MHNFDLLHSKTFFVEEAFLEKTDLFKEKTSCQGLASTRTNSTEQCTANTTPLITQGKPIMIM